MQCGLRPMSLLSSSRSIPISVPVSISRTIASASRSSTCTRDGGDPFKHTGRHAVVGKSGGHEVVKRSWTGRVHSTRQLSGFEFGPIPVPLYHNRRQLHTSTLSTSISDLSWRISKKTYRYSTSSLTDDAKNEEENFPLPLPRSLAPSTGLFLLHLPIPPQNWPSHLNIHSNLLRQATLYFKKRGVNVNCIYDGTGVETDFKEEERYHARLITPRGSVERGEFDKGVLGSQEFRRQVEALLNPPSANLGEQEAKGVDQGSEIEVLVCTHGSRDCRCSDRGGGLVQALEDEITRRDLERVKVREIAHVGGHKYAANAIILPSLDMYSNLLPTDASAMLDHLTASYSNTNRSQFNKHWRGRYGSTEEEQAKIWASINPDPGADLEIESKKQATVPLRFKTFEGEIKVVDAKIGDTLLQVARQWDLPSMEGSCGGNLECSTCHVYIPLSCPIPEPTDSELDMLGYALGFNEDESRLGCQVVVDAGLGEWCKSGGELGLPRY